MITELRHLVEGTLMVLAALIPIVNPLGNALARPHWAAWPERARRL